MKAVFADTFYFLALLNERDTAHKRAVAASRTPGLAFVTTELVLIELADALRKPPQRDEVRALSNVVEADDNAAVETDHWCLKSASAGGSFLPQ